MIALSSPRFYLGKNCFDFRTGIEGEAAGAAARNRTTVDLIRMADSMERLEKSSGSVTAWPGRGLRVPPPGRSSFAQ